MDNIPTPLKTFIYALADPETGEIRYIGKTIKLRLRLLKHFSDAKRLVARTHCAAWIRKILDRRLEPRMIVLCECAGDGCSEERFHISLAKHNGFRLTNLTDGGEGLLGMPKSEETRRRLKASWKRGNRFSDEARAKMSASAKAKIARDPEAHRTRTGNSWKKAVAAARAPAAKAKRLESRKSYRYPPEVRAKISASLTGKKQSPESIAKRVAKMIGRRNPRPPGWVMSPEHRAALTASRKGKKVSEVTRDRMQQAQLLRFAERPISDQTRAKIAATIRARGTSRGENSSSARVTEQDVLDIRRRYAAGEKLKALVLAFKISKAAAWRIVARRTWVHVADDRL